MRKVLCTLGMSAALLLAACSSEGEDKAPEEDSAPAQDAGKQDTAGTKDTTAPADSPSEDGEPLDLEEGDAYPLKYFGTEASYAELENDSDDFAGSIDHDFDGFKLSTIYFLVDLKPNEMHSYDYDEKETVRAILVMMHAENTTDGDVDYNGTMTITTDTKEQVNPEFGALSPNQAVMTYYGNVESAGYYIIPLKDGSEPNEITVIMEPPYKVEDGAVDPINGAMGEEQRFSLTGYAE